MGFRGPGCQRRLLGQLKQLGHRLLPEFGPIRLRSCRSPAELTPETHPRLHLQRWRGRQRRCPRERPAREEARAPGRQLSLIGAQSSRIPLENQPERGQEEGVESYDAGVTDCGRLGPKFDDVRDIWSTSINCGQALARFSPTWPKVDHIDRFWSTWSNLGRIWARSATMRPNTANFCRTWADSRLGGQHFDNVWTLVRQPYDNFGDHCDRRGSLFGT